MLDHAARLTFKHFSTLFLFLAAVTLPLHMLYAIVFNDVIAVGDLHPAIETFNEFRKVRNVGTAELTAFRLAGAGIAAIEIALLPALAKGAVEIVTTGEEGGLATVGGALRAAVRDRDYSELRRGVPVGPVALAAIFALLLGLVVEQAGLLLADLLLSPDRLFAAFGPVQSAARSVAAPFFLVAWNVSARGAKVSAPSTPRLY